MLKYFRSQPGRAAGVPAASTVSTDAILNPRFHWLQWFIDLDPAGLEDLGDHLVQRRICTLMSMTV